MITVKTIIVAGCGIIAAIIVLTIAAFYIARAAATGVLRALELYQRKFQKGKDEDQRETTVRPQVRRD